jgi:hypothetical protein
MRASLRSASSVLALCALAGCSTLKVSTDYDRGADFARYTSFEFMHEGEVANPLARERLETAITRELGTKGLRRLPGAPDLWVAVHLRPERTTELDTAHFGYTWGHWGYWGGGRAATTVRTVPVGTLIIDLVDAREHTLVWQAVAADAIDRHASAEKKEYLVNTAVAKMLAGYPPPRGR